MPSWWLLQIQMSLYACPFESRGWNILVPVLIFTAKGAKEIYHDVIVEMSVAMVLTVSFYPVKFGQQNRHSLPVKSTK